MVYIKHLIIIYIHQITDRERNVHARSMQLAGQQPLQQEALTWRACMSLAIYRVVRTCDTGSICLVRNDETRCMRYAMRG